MDPLRVGLKAQGVYKIPGGERGCSGPLAQVEAELDQAGTYAAAVFPIGWGPEGIAAAEGALPSAGRAGRRAPVSRRPRREVHGEDGELTRHVRVDGGVLLASDAEVALVVVDHGRAKEL